MPKIIISEKDNTSNGFRAYSNFAVAIPGFIGDEERDTALNLEDYFDENGVYECSDPAEFRDVVGYRTPRLEFSTSGPAQAPTVDQVYYIKESGETAIPDTVPGDKESVIDFVGTNFSTTNAEQAAFLDAIKNGRLYLAVAKAADDTTVGKLQDEHFRYEQVSADADSSIDVEVGDADGDGEDELILTEVSTLSLNSFYCTLSFEGEDVGEVVEQTYHHGNQIAHELLALGYTVLYKKLDEDLLEVEGEGDEATWKFLKDGLNDSEFWKPLKDKATYDFRYIMTGLLENNAEANERITEIAEGISNDVQDSTSIPSTYGRGDCIALVDIDRTWYAGKNTSEAVEAIKTALSASDGPSSSPYAAIFAPTVRYNNLSSAGTCKNNEMPASFHYLACAAKAFENFNEWYAVAGYTRGVSRLNVIGTGVKFGDLAVEELQPRTKESDGVAIAVNLIINTKGNYYLWGNRTAHILESEKELEAQHFLNIRQLCTTIKKQAWTACRRFTYDPNSDVLWVNFCAAIKPTLEKMKADQGISDYKITKRKPSGMGILSARIRIVPIEAVEDFYINLSLEDSISGVVLDEGESE